MGRFYGSILKDEVLVSGPPELPGLIGVCACDRRSDAECADNSFSEGPRLSSWVSDGKNISTDINAIVSRNI